jgi:predicted TPR repeat methyltransferase
MSPPRDARHFDDLYAASPDPWNFETSPYEAEKYAATIAALDGRRFAHGFEVGCSIGVLTARLAAQCDRLLAVDLAAAALAAARARNRAAANVTFATATIPADWPGQAFDLIILSEVLYFLSAEEIDDTALRAHRSLAAGGVILLVNYLGRIDEPLGGDAVAERFMVTYGGSWTTIRAPGYRIDRLRSAG